ncbi:hypothetical protein LXA43DRAFT_885059 [Ganoderma leucocontextum]|nr:hypothetical protein LXA43DRAFT_885059 [Ganoderma leucocontextum]
MSITTQPFAINAPAVAPCDRNTEKGCSHEQHHGHQYAHVHDTESRRCRCNRTRGRRTMITIALALFSVIMFLLALCLWDAAFNQGSWLNALGLTVDGSENSWTALSGLMKRQSDGSTASSSTFVNHKYYLIIIFVGLFLVVLAGICLSAWCCRESFENPLCCPCYLCACCGGLACLECIGCGLCAEGIEQM